MFFYHISFICNTIRKIQTSPQKGGFDNPCDRPQPKFRSLMQSPRVEDFARLVDSAAS